MAAHATPATGAAPGDAPGNARYRARMGLPTAPVAAGSMLGSYVIASRLGSNPGAVAALVGPLAWCATRWRQEQGEATAAALTLTYLAGFGGSHPLARRIGAWPAVLAATALTGAASHLAADRR